MMSLWLLYRGEPLTRTFVELRRAHRKAASGVSFATGRISHVEKEMAKVERTVKRLANQHEKKRKALKADFDKRQRRASHEIESIDRQLAQLGSRRQREISLRLKQYQNNYVNESLSRTIVSANQVPGVGTQLVMKLQYAGIRSAADFVGLGYVSNGRSTTAYFRLASGRQIHISGIGEVKARRIDQWRQAQLANAIRHQPSALPASELHAIDARFATEKRQLEEERTRLSQQIADQIAIIRRELDAALDDVDKQHQTELIPISQQKTELAAHLGHAHSGHLTAQQQLLDWDNRLAMASRPAFGHFVSAAIRG
jgi:DNA anti-recombination protein RmuC